MTVILIAYKEKVEKKKPSVNQLPSLSILEKALQDLESSGLKELLELKRLSDPQ